MPNTEKPLTYIGPSTAQMALYLPNLPIVDGSFDPVSPNVTQLIKDNGNHWRKILTILAKLSVQGKGWKNYRDTQLLQQREMVCFEDQIRPNVLWHLIGGKASWQRLGFDSEDFAPINLSPIDCSSKKAQASAYYKNNVILMPYPDYRQLPNALIGQIVDLIGA